DLKPSFEPSSASTIGLSAMGGTQKNERERLIKDRRRQRIKRCRARQQPGRISRGQEHSEAPVTFPDLLARGRHRPMRCPSGYRLLPEAAAKRRYPQARRRWRRSRWGGGGARVARRALSTPEAARGEAQHHCRRLSIRDPRA